MGVRLGLAPASRYRKFFTALGTALAGIASFLADGEISQNDVIGGAALLVGALLVLRIPNTTPDQES